MEKDDVMDYIKWIRSKVGNEKIILNFTSGILCISNKILLQRRRDKNKWGLPGGAIELGESAEETIKREFLEETGLVISDVKLQNIYSKYEDTYPNGDKAQVITIAYVVNVKELKSINNFSNSETLELKFFKFDELKDVEIVNQQHIDMISDFILKNNNINR